MVITTTTLAMQSKKAACNKSNEEHYEREFDKVILFYF